MDQTSRRGVGFWLLGVNRVLMAASMVVWVHMRWREPVTTMSNFGAAATNAYTGLPGFRISTYGRGPFRLEVHRLPMLMPGLAGKPTVRSPGFPTWILRRMRLIWG